MPDIEEVKDTFKNVKSVSDGPVPFVICSIIGAALGALAYYFFSDGNGEKPHRERSHTQNSERPKEKIFKSDTCVICIDAEPALHFRPCGHLCICEKCVVKSVRAFKYCPACRQPITEMVISQDN